MRRTLVVLAFLAALLPSLSAGETAKPSGWPQFLGPQRDGLCQEQGLNLDWQHHKPKLLWKAPLGPAFSSISVVGNRLYTMVQRGKYDCVVCLDAKSGKEIWTCAAAPAYVDRQRQGPGPRATPTYHQGKLYCQMARGELLCLDAARGVKLWEKDIFKETGATNPTGDWYYWGVSFSPLVVDDLVIVQPGGRKGNSVAAFHKDSGKLVWTAGSEPINYASPILRTIAGQRQIICPTGQAVLGIEPAKGKVLWRYALGNAFNATGSNPVWAEDTLFISTAYGGGCAALEIRRQGDSWQARPRWKSKKGLQTLFATSIVHEGYLYGCHGDIGALFLRCLNLKTGQQQWEKRLPGRVTLLGIGASLLVLEERGSLHLIEMTPKRYTLKASLPDLLHYKAWAAPALAEGRLYLRDQQHILCLDLRQSSPKQEGAGAGTSRPRGETCRANLDAFLTSR
jgi:outer membrane protein assembly factor BamB